MLKKTLISIALCAAFSSPACADDIVIPVRPEQTTVTWTLGAFLHAVHGRFAVKSGLLRLDPQSNTVGGDVTIDLASGESGNAKRDAKMRDDVLETAKYPTAVFTARSLDGRLAANGASHFTLNGTLLVHGERHDLTLPLEVIARDGQVESGATHFSIPYVAWGMRDPSVFLLRVENHVDVDVRMTTAPVARPSGS